MLSIKVSISVPKKFGCERKEIGFEKILYKKIGIQKSLGFSDYMFRHTLTGVAENVGALIWSDDHDILHLPYINWYIKGK